MLNRPEDQADALVQDNDDINGAATIDPDTRPAWKRHFGKIVGAIGVGVMLAAGTVQTGPDAFVVQTAEGLARDTVNNELAIDLAEHCERPMYMGRIQSPEFEIGYEAARQLDARNIQVTVGGLQAGDVFNPRRNIYGVWASDACPARLNDELLYN